MVPIPPPPTDVDQLHTWLASFTNWETQAPLGAERREWGPLRCRKLLDRANLDTSNLRVIQVAGSKGKGSTVLWMEALLALRGERCAATTSPHLISLEERIRIDGKSVPFPRLLEELQKLYPALDEGAKAGDPTPTFFDLWTALFVSVAITENIPTMLLEVGLGGPLDSTTAIPHDTGVLTTVDLEHTTLLGNTVEEIAAEKARIARNGKPFVISTGDSQAISIQVATSLGAIPIVATVDERLPRGIPPSQALNASTALCTLESVPDFECWSRAEVESAALRVRLPGRLELLPGPPQLLLDGAHTPASIRAFVDEFSRYRGANRCGAILLGMLDDKNPGETLSALGTLAPQPHICTVSIPTPRGMTARDLARALEPIFERLPCVADSPEFASQWLKKKAAIGEPIAATGSMYLAGLIGQDWHVADEQNYDSSHTHFSKG